MNLTSLPRGQLPVGTGCDRLTREAFESWEMVPAIRPGLRCSRLRGRSPSYAEGDSANAEKADEKFESSSRVICLSRINRCHTAQPFPRVMILIDVYQNQVVTPTTGSRRPLFLLLSLSRLLLIPTIDRLLPSPIPSLPGTARGGTKTDYATGST